MKIYESDLYDFLNQIRNQSRFIIKNMTILYLSILTIYCISITYCCISYYAQLRDKKKEILKHEVSHQKFKTNSQSEIECLKNELTKLKDKNSSQKHLINLITKKQGSQINQMHQQEELENTLFNSEIYKKICYIANIETEKKFTKEDWEELINEFEKTYNNLLFRIKHIGKNISEDDIRLCCLCKFHFKNKEISKLLNKTKTAISSEKSRMYLKITNHKGLASDFQKLIDAQ